VVAKEGYSDPSLPPAKGKSHLHSNPLNVDFSLRKGFLQEKCLMRLFSPDLIKYCHNFSKTQFKGIFSW